jgi:hypothetical protein
METPLNSLLAKSSPAIAPQLVPGEVRDTLGEAYASLDNFLAVRNGFYAFHRALHVFPLFSNADELGVTEWNLPNLWRNAYPNMAPSGVFFAEDIFGGQFWTNGRNICMMDEESGVFSLYAQTLEDWAHNVIANDGESVGAILAYEWTQKNSPLGAGFRLAPKIPFVLEGSSGIENLYAANSIAVMKFRADIASQLKNIPDGTSVRMKVI